MFQWLLPHRQKAEAAEAVRTPLPHRTPRRRTQHPRRMGVELQARDLAVPVRQAVVPAALAQPDPVAPVLQAVVPVAQAKIAEPLEAPIAPAQRVVIGPEQPLAIVLDKRAVTGPERRVAIDPEQPLAIVLAQRAVTGLEQPLATAVAQAPLAVISPQAAATFPSGAEVRQTSAGMDRFAPSTPTE